MAKTKGRSNPSKKPVMTKPPKRGQYIKRIKQQTKNRRTGK